LIYSSLHLDHLRLYDYIYHQYADLRYSDHAWKQKKYAPRPPAKKRFDDEYELEILQLERLLNIPKAESYFNPKNADRPYRPKTGSAIADLLADERDADYPNDPFDDLGFI
jgi:secreted Zn-dependent insulinase-like peptidase